MITYVTDIALTCVCAELRCSSHAFDDGPSPQHACILCMLEFCASMQGRQSDVGSTASQFILALHSKHVVLGAISMWWSNISCVEVVIDGMRMPGAESIRGRGRVRVGGGPHPAWPG